MGKAARLAEQLEDLEREYRSVFVRALTACADGRWGLFGHNDHTGFGSPPPELEELRELARAIDRIRKRTGDAPFQLHQEFEAARGRADPNEPGEPKQADAWLRRLSDN